MALSIISASPYNNQNLVAIDSKIELEFSSPVDPFTIANGISVFHNIAPNWNGESASILDKPTTDIGDIGQEYSFATYNYTINGNTIVITPTKALDQNIDYYIQVAPGNDATRFVSQQTVSDLTYNRSGTSTSLLSITSAYTGEDDTTYVLEFGANKTFDLTVGGVYKDSYTYVNSIPLDIFNLQISIDSSFDVGDTVTIPVFKAVGMTTLYKSKFSTSRYDEVAISSSRIEDELYKLNVSTLKIVSSVPGSLSLNNRICNPVVVKFNKPLDQTQDISQYVNIFKTNIETGSSKRINFYYKFLGTDSIKLYLIGLDHLSTIADLPLYNPLDKYSNKELLDLNI